MAAMFAAANGALDVLKLLFGSYVDSDALDIAALVRAAAGNDRVAAMELTLKEPAGEKLRRNPSLLVPALSHAVRRHCVKSTEFLVQMGVCASGNDCGIAGSDDRSDAQDLTHEREAQGQTFVSQCRRMGSRRLRDGEPRRAGLRLRTGAVYLPESFERLPTTVSGRGTADPRR